MRLSASSPGGQRLGMGILAATLACATGIPVAAGEPAPIVVNRAGDLPDLDAGAGACDTSAAAGRQCTLRAAVETANGRPGRDVVRFTFPGDGPVVIHVPTALPAITDPLEIDGYSVRGARQNTSAVGTDARLRVVVRGPGSGSVDGLDVRSSTVIRGLVVQGFATGIMVHPGGDGSRIQGNFIGTNASGRTRYRNEAAGIHVDCLSSIRVGGSSAAHRNIVSGNRDGIVLCEKTQGTAVQGNLIGVAADGRTDLGNERAGIFAYGTQDALIGGGTARAANVIAFNDVGVVLQSADGIDVQGVRILRNSIHSNRALGIDLGWDGATPNDGPGDADTGANDLQNAPSIRSAITRGGRTIIKGSLASTPLRTFTVRLHANPAGTSQGHTFLGQRTVTTDAAGRVDFRLTIDRPVPVGRVITATATDELLDQTSEFSKGRSARR